MKIVTVVAGSRGDVQPYIALGKGLQAAGHQVTIATHGIFGEWIAGHGLGFAQVEGNPREMIEGRATGDWLASGRSGLRFVKGFREVMGGILQQAVSDAWQAVQDADFLIASSLGYYPVSSIAEKTGQPWVQTFLQPIFPTRAFPSALFPVPVRLGGLGNLLTHSIGGLLFWQMIRPGMNRARREVLGLPPLDLKGPFPRTERQKIPALYGYSSAFIPRPAEWPDHHHVVGYWFLEEGEGWQPPGGLARFLEDGPPPVYVGFGSMATGDAAEMTAVVLGALRETGQRGVLLTGWGGIDAANVPADICVIDSAPHDWLFPRMAAVVHHGGAGTVAAGLRAGVPTIVVPFFGDQPWWGERIREAGVGPAPIDRQHLTVDRLAAAITAAVTDEDMRRRAARLGEQIRAENGVASAVALIERCAG